MKSNKLNNAIFFFTNLDPLQEEVVSLVSERGEKKLKLISYLKLK